MGMSQEALQGAGEEGTPPPGTEPGQGGTPAPVEQPNPYSLAAEFIQQVPEAQRPLIEPYVKKWDAGVTKRFQELHSKFSPYEELGADPEVLAQAYQIYQTLDQSPEVIYNILKEALEGETPGAGAPTVPGAVETEEDVYSQIPPELTQRLEKNERLLEQVAQFILNSRQKEVEAQEDAELDAYLGQLKETHGEFDQDWVLVRMSQGMDAEDAVKAWQNLLQQQVNSMSGSANGLPPTLSGGGSVPTETVNLKDLPRKDVRGLVAGLLSQANQGGE